MLSFPASGFSDPVRVAQRVEEYLLVFRRPELQLRHKNPARSACRSRCLFRGCSSFTDAMNVPTQNPANRFVHLLVAFLVAGLCLPPTPLRAQSSPTPAAVPQNTTQQQPGQSAQPVLRSSSDLVRIDVEVTDRSGKPVKGLKADQFVVTDDGQSQRVSIFTYEDIEAVETAPDTDTKPIVLAVDTPTDAVAQTEGDQARDRRLMVLFFDLTSLANDDLVRAHDSALKFVKQQMTKADLVSVVSFSSNLRVLSDFTNDRDKLNKAIAQLLPGVSSNLADSLYAPAQNGEYDVQQDNGAAFTADETEFNVFNTDQKLEALEGMANVLGAIPGRKSLIEFTGGITQTGEENRTQLRAATDAANRANVSIYSIDARGLMAAVPGGDVTSDAATGTSMFTGASVYHQTDQREDSRDTLATLATDTGGRAFFDLGDLSDAFPKIQQDNGGYYLVGYYLNANVKRDGAWHAVRVKVNAPGVKVRYRNGYYAPRDFQHLERESRDEQLAEADSLRQSRWSSCPSPSKRPCSASTMSRCTFPSPRNFPPRARLGAKAWPPQAEFDFAAELRAVPSGPNRGPLRDTINVHARPAALRAGASRRISVYQGGVVLSPGAYRMKFVARENESGKIGTFEQALAVPAPVRPAQAAHSAPFCSPASSCRWKNPPKCKPKRKALAPSSPHPPLEMQGQRIVPSVTRFFSQQQTLYVFFQAYYPENRQAEPFDASALRAGPRSSSAMACRSTPRPAGARG